MIRILTAMFCLVKPLVGTSSQFLQLQKLEVIVEI